ncbi:MAG: hypothetical protein ACXV5J_11920 [Candidatus Angelobacter sp.]
MSNSLPNAEPREYNSSAVLAVYDILRRQPWKTVAVRTWDTVRRFLLSTLVAASLATSFASLLPTMAEAKSYQVLSSYVPFKFQVGDQTFKPGRYDFIMAGPGIVAMRDEHQHFVASITTRSRTTGGMTSSPKLVFNTHTKTAQLIQIWAAKGEPGMDVVGEETAVRPAQSTVPADALQPGLEFLMSRPSAPGLKH